MLSTITIASLKAAPNSEPLLLWRIPHPSLQAKSSCSNSPYNGNVLALLERGIYHKTMTKNKPRLLLRSTVACWTGLLKHAALCTVTQLIWECVSMATLIYVHSTAIPTNREPSKLVEERIFHAHQVRTWTIYKKKCPSEEYVLLYIVL